MEGCTLNGRLCSYGDMNFTNCQFVQNNSDYHMWTYAGNVTYDDCTFTNNATGKFINVFKESTSERYTVKVNNSKFINKATTASKAALNVKATSGSNLLSYDVIINNCTTDGAFPEANWGSTLVVLNNLAQVDDRTASGVDNITVTQDGTLIYPKYVAQVGETKYPTLAAAVAAVPAGTETTITMIDNEKIQGNAGVTIPAGKNIILDLNGKTITGDVTESKSAQTILNQGTLTVKDSSEDLTGTLTNEVSDTNAGSPGENKNWYSNVITNNGTLTVSSGNIANTGNGGACYAIDNITNSTLYTAILNINGGSISAVKTTIRMFCNSTTNDNTLNMTGGSVKGGNGIQTMMPNNNANKATVNISGGYIQGYYAWYDYGNKNVSTQFDNANYTISGGFFTGWIYSYAGSYCGKDGFITGGYYNEELTDKYIADGYIAAANTDEETKEAYPYIVREGTYVAQIVTGESVAKYETLEAAFAAANDGETIKLLADCAGNGIKVAQGRNMPRI